MMASTITLGSLSDALEVLQNLTNQQFDGATSTKIIQLSRWAHPHYLRYITFRAEQAEKYGDKISHNKFRISADKVEEFYKSIAPLRAEIIEINSDLLLDPRIFDKIKISPNDLEILEPLMLSIIV